MTHFYHIPPKRTPSIKGKQASPDTNFLRVGADLASIVSRTAYRRDLVGYLGADGAFTPQKDEEDETIILNGGITRYVEDAKEIQFNTSALFPGHTSDRFLPNLTERLSQFSYPAAVGAVMHQALHLRFSRLDPELLAQDHVLGSLAQMFEELRIEIRGSVSFPHNKLFLRASALGLAWEDILSDPHKSLGLNDQQRSFLQLSQALILLLARAHVGIVADMDVEFVREHFAALLPEETLAKLMDVAGKASRVSHSECTETLLMYAQEWVDIFKEDAPDMEPDAEGEGAEDAQDGIGNAMQGMMGDNAPGKGDPGDSGEADGEGSPSEGAGSASPSGSWEEAMAKAAAMARAEGMEQHNQELAEARTKEIEAAAREEKDAKDTASEVFGRGTGPVNADTRSRLVTERQPTTRERQAAVILSRELAKAKYRDRVATKASSIVPPGRLNTRRAIQAREQRHRGAPLSVEPWKRTMRKNVDDPELKIGMMVDISGSMSGAMEPMAAASWILPEAARRISGQCATVYYGNDVFPTLSPGDHQKMVRVYSAPDGTERFDKGFRALNGKMNLLGGRGARLLVIVSDLYHTSHEVAAASHWIRRCIEEGVAVINIPFGDDSSTERLSNIPARGFELITSSETTTMTSAAKAIGKAAVRQLKQVSSDR